MEWTKEFELEYWTAYGDEYYLDKCREKYDLFDVDSYFDKKVELAVDVGGGKFGGALYFFKQAQRKVLIDILAKEYDRMHTVPEDIIPAPCDFAYLPYGEEMIDVLFAWSVLGHALSEGHFYKGQAELVRILRPGGLFFFEQRLLDKPCQGHTVVLSKDEILKGFSKLNKIKEMVVNERVYVVYEG